MSGWEVVAAYGLVLVPAGMAVLVLVVHDQVVLWRGRRLIRRVIEQETARHIGELVPEQRESSDPVWWEFVPQQRQGDDR